PARANSRPYAGGARKATQSVEPAPHLELAATSVNVPSRLPIITSGAWTYGVTAPNRRPGSGGRPASTLAGTASPDQPIVTVGGAVGVGTAVVGAGAAGEGEAGGAEIAAGTAGSPLHAAAIDSAATTAARRPCPRIRRSVGPRPRHRPPPRRPHRPPRPG